MPLEPTDNIKDYSLSAAVNAALSVKTGQAQGFSGLYGSSRAFFVASLFRSAKKPVLCILPDDEDAEAFAGDLKFFLGPEAVSLYPSPEALPFDSLPVHQEIRSARIELLYRFLNEGLKPFITVASAPTLMQRIVPKESLKGREIVIKKGSEYPYGELAERLLRLGYSKMSLVEERGEMSIRGHILDIFPPASPKALRIDFFGDEVESIRTFDISSQRSLKELGEVRILPAAETSGGASSEGARERLIERADVLGLERKAYMPLSSRLRDKEPLPAAEVILPLFYEKLDTIFDYLCDETIIAVIDPSRVEAETVKFEGSVQGAALKLSSDKTFFVSPESLYMGREEFSSLAGRYPSIRVEHLYSGGVELKSSSNMDLRQGLNVRKKGESPLLKPLADNISGWLEEGGRVYLTAHNRAQAERTKELLEGYGFKPPVINGADLLEAGAPPFAVAVGALSTGFRLPAPSLAVVSEEEVFGVERVKRRAPPSKKLDAFLLQLQDLSAGDAVVHAQHGIGLYKGLNRLSVDNVESEFLILEYRDGDKLYLPVLRTDLVSKYHGFEGRSPSLDKLGGTGWVKTKKRVKKAVELLAGELLKLYAERRSAEGFSFSPPDPLFREFEASFEYDETPDQARAIEECLADMQEIKPMDRLVCGDVGYGKTEVAIRAAFKAVLDGKQVAVLVPTTVLAQQHYQTFSKRLSAYPAAVGVLSRFVGKKEQALTAERLKKGELDIIIGTHRLLQKDVAFKDLGLIVIDEEHRFGVKQKERLKQLKKTVDCLTLTATPIPRTLHMSLASVRDLSIINTPPEDRLAIKTSVVRFDEGVIAEAIERELKRGGQVFFVHNRIESIGTVSDVLKKVVPHARVAVAHGRMNETELEKKMLGFVGREYDILLSTAIIESGLDIPSANTIIINRADRFGLAELYQLRGRVGRSSHRAYAYFICPEAGSLTDEARKRIEVIQELCEPGSGFKIATYDLEIRGAGELLGTSQSGHIAEVGFDMYTELLEEAVREIKGEGAEEEIEPDISLRVAHYIPEEYIPDARQRLNFYKRLASVPSGEGLDGVKEELEDRFGPVPGAVENLISLIGLKLMLKRLRAKELVQKANRLYISFSSGEAGPGVEVGDKILQLVKKEPKRFRVTPEERLTVLMPPDGEPLNEARYILKELLGGCYI